ncbi:MAG: hypothetical protein JWO64_3049 [Hyphomicrobiales bacterium]|nr:hypothetical protein [Hyphomicrobiales bacterium]
MAFAGVLAPAIAEEARSIPLASPSVRFGQAPDLCRPDKTGSAGGQVRWVVRRPASAEASAVIAETSREHTDPKYPICIVDGLRATDLDISVDIRPVEGDIDRAGGLAVRLADRNNYYLVRANALEQNVRLYRVVKGVRTQFAGVETPVASNMVQRLRLEVKGDRFIVEFSGKKLFDASDKTFTSGGGVALWSKADSLTEFANLAIAVLKE